MLLNESIKMNGFSNDSYIYKSFNYKVIFTLPEHSFKALIAWTKWNEYIATSFLPAGQTCHEKNRCI